MASRRGDADNDNVLGLPRPEIGGVAPDFVLTDQDGQSVTLMQFRGRRTVLFFHAAGAVGETQLRDATPGLNEIEGGLAGVLAISPGTAERLAHLRDAVGTQFPLLADPECNVLQAYGAMERIRDASGDLHWNVIPSTVLITADAYYEATNFETGTDTVTLARQLATDNDNDSDNPA